MKQFFILLAAIAFGLLCSCEQTPVKVDVESVTLNKTAVVLDKGDTVRLVATVLPENATNKTVLWMSGDEDVATVSNDGVVTAVATGETVVNVLCGTVSAECSVTVNVVTAGSVEITPSDVELMVGEKTTLAATVLPEDTADKTVAWTSSDEACATVSENGEVTAVAIGEAVITATCGNAFAECSVTVVPVPVESVTLDMTELDMFVGDTYQLTAAVLPENASDKEVTWSSSDNSVATVESGLVTAVGDGEAVITASCGGYAAECSVTSTRPQPKVGDIFYSDGTYSTELDGSKTPIGVIFYVGDPSVDDAAMRKEHPECVNGLVVSLKSENGDWQTEYKAYDETVSSWVEANTEYEATATYNHADANFNKLVGYNNTKAYEAFNAAAENASWPVTIAERVSAYNVAVPAPENTTGWYIPSMKEVAYLCIGGPIDESIYRMTGTENKDLLNAVIANIPDAEELTNNWWTSSEMVNGTGVYIANVTYGNFSTNSFGKTSPLYLSRYILAF